MFPIDYFAARYFAPRYWPEVGATVIVVGLTPADRTLFIGADVRALIIAADDRTLAIPADDRTLTVVR